MSCGFGAVVLVFMIIDHSIKAEVIQSNQTSQVEVDLLKSLIFEEKEKKTSLDLNYSELSDSISFLQQSIEKLKLKLPKNKIASDPPEFKAPTRNQLTQINTEVIRLESNINILESEREALLEQSPLDFTGTGGRQRLSGCSLQGRHIAILLDTSASMLEMTVADVYALQNEPRQTQQASPKWRSAIKSLQWILGSLPAQVKYQVLSFNENVESLPKTKSNDWLNSENQSELQNLSTMVSKILPVGGTNLEMGLQSVARLKPPPDSVWLITDGLPNISPSRSASNKVTARQREKFFLKAMKVLPNNASLNTVLMPFEGDAEAAPYFWNWAMEKNGCFITPERNWGVNEKSLNYTFSLDAEKSLLGSSWPIPSDV